MEAKIRAAAVRGLQVRKAREEKEKIREEMMKMNQSNVEKMRRRRGKQDISMYVARVLGD